MRGNWDSFVTEPAGSGSPAVAWHRAQIGPERQAYVSFRQGPYDIEAEIDRARASGMPDLGPYAIELRSGVYRGRHAELGLTFDP